MTEPTIDPERLAALIDGRTAGEAKAALLREIDASDECREILAEVESLLSEMGPDAVPSQARVRAARFPSALIAGLSVAAAVVIAVNLSRRVLVGEGAARFEQLLGSAAPIGRAHGSEWRAMQWPTVRSEASVTSERGRAVRIGVRLTDLAYGEVHDSAIAAMARRELRDLLTPLAASGPVVQLLDLPSDRQVSADSLAPFAMALIDSNAVRKGAWLEAARLAAERRRAEFFLADVAHWNQSQMTEPLALLVRSSEWERVRRATDSLLREASR